MKRRISLGLLALTVLAVVAVSPAAGKQQANQAQVQVQGLGPNFKVIGDEIPNSPAEIHSMKGMQHGESGDHLPGSSENGRSSVRSTSTAWRPIAWPT